MTLSTSSHHTPASNADGHFCEVKGERLKAKAWANFIPSLRIFLYLIAMGLFNNLFGKKKQPEDYYDVIVTGDSITVRRWGHTDESIFWSAIKSIRIVNTDEGPAAPDVWLVLAGESSKCKIPQGCSGFEEVYQIVSQYDGFNFDNFIASMSTANNAEFLLWSKEE